ncbi:hypothetical protein JXM67_14635 [candidate division WOR-3 bacterium]|nr:hypothetical protein [candidate division WOR-3 bacterium]
MKKLLVMLTVVILIAGCGFNIPDYEGIKKLVTEDLEVTVQPENQGVSIIIEGFPAEDELPKGFDGISVYVSETDLDSVPYADLPAPAQDGIKEDDSIYVGNLVNGVEHYAQGRGEMDDTVTTMGFGGKFYPRPWGQGSYLGYDPENPDHSGYAFDRDDGIITESSTENSDLYFEVREVAYSAIEVYAVVVGEGAGIQEFGGTEEWLDVQDWNQSGDAYGSEVMVEAGGIYQFMTGGEYYGKFEVDSIVVEEPAFLGEGDVKVWLKYAFQTAQHVGHY